MSDYSEIKKFKFDINTPNELKKVDHGTNWPVVYIINNDKEAYVGETTDASKRMGQHLKNPERKNLKEVRIILNDEFNKSSILDLESYLIKYMGADGKYVLQNGNGGLQDHDYYDRERYQEKFKKIWSKLKELKIVNKEIDKIKNSDLFKYSPYKSLTEEQENTVNEVLKMLKQDFEEQKEESTFVINGGAGTGKTILGIYLIKLLTEIKENKNEIYFEEEETQDNLKDILDTDTAIQKLQNIAFVVPMQSLRKTIKEVFKKVKGLKNVQVLSPYEVGKSENKFDLLIVDEAHRLRQRKLLGADIGCFDKINRKFGLDNTGTELDWILSQSKYRIFFYDKNQTIKPADIEKEKFKQLQKDHEVELKLQMRCKGGNEYIEYINQIFSDNPPEEKKYFKGVTEYDFKIFDNVKEMTESIRNKEIKDGIELCRNLAGYAWKWETKNIKDKLGDSYDIEIEGYKYIWNTTDKEWINSKNAINEIGCIHTSQGYDLNYTGLIIGNELKYDKENKKIIIDRKEYKDPKGQMKSVTDKELREYILNIYKVMCTRGMYGTYIYACDKNLREYLKQFI